MKRNATKLDAATRLVVETYYPSDGKWLYDAFDAVNAKFFDGEIPTPLITVEITPHSHCLGWCVSRDDAPPRIAIHPTMLGFRELPDPWGIPNEWLGRRMAFDTLVHECMHASVHYRLGGWEGPSSHNNPQWISEVNRIAPLLGLKNVDAAMQVARRVPVEGEFTKTGKPKTVVKKVSDGNVPFNTVSSFPLSMRQHFSTAAKFYTRGRLPVPGLSLS